MTYILNMSNLYAIFCFFVKYAYNKIIYMTNIFMPCTLIFWSYDMLSLCHKYVSHLLSFVAHPITI